MQLKSHPLGDCRGVCGTEASELGPWDQPGAQFQANGPGNKGESDLRQNVGELTWPRGAGRVSWSDRWPDVVTTRLGWDNTACCYPLASVQPSVISREPSPLMVGSPAAASEGARGQDTGRSLGSKAVLPPRKPHREVLGRSPKEVRGAHCGLDADEPSWRPLLSSKEAPTVSRARCSARRPRSADARPSGRSEARRGEAGGQSARMAP